MLILSRKAGQVIRIGNDIFISVIAIKGNRIEIGITAPKELPVHREEVFASIRAEDGSLEAVAQHG